MAVDASQLEGIEPGEEGLPPGDGSTGSPPGTLTTNDSEVAAWFKAQKLGSIVPALVDNGWDDMYVECIYKLYERIYDHTHIFDTTIFSPLCVMYDTCLTVICC